MKVTIVAIVIVVLLIVGFWWTRGAGGGGIPGGINDPAFKQFQGLDQMGDSVAIQEEHEDREHEIE
jgi:hypothetical protein